MTKAHFVDPKQAALALLNSDVRLTKRAGQFLGQIVADPSGMSDKQTDWLVALLERAKLPPFAMEGQQ